MDATVEKGPNEGVRSVRNALRILEELSKSQPIGVSDLSRQLELPKSSTFRSLQTLAQAGWVQPAKGEPPRWVLSTKVFTIGLAASVETTLRELAITEMTCIRDALGETVHLTVPDETNLVVIAHLDGTNSLRTFLALGTRAPLHATAGGRAMLSAMGDAEVNRLLDQGIEAYTDRTTLDRDAIWAEITSARERGYAINSAEWRTHIAAIASPIVSRSGQVLAAISISMPMSRYQEIDHAEAGALTMASCRRIATELTDGY